MVHLDVEESYSTQFPMTEDAINSLNTKIKKLLSDFAKDNGYNTKMDYILCSLYPEERQHCQDYYGGSNKQIDAFRGSRDLKKMDQIMSKSIKIFESKYNDLLKENENA